MSRTTNIVSSPCVKFLEWRTVKDAEGEKVIGGTFAYYDKELGQKVDVALPFKFALLNMDNRTIKGFNKDTEKGIWSNEVRTTHPNDILKVRTKDGIFMEFPLKDYKDNKKELAGNGGNYTIPVYIAVEGDNGYEIWAIMAFKTCLTGGNDQENNNPDERNDGWLSFSKYNKNKLFSKFIMVEEPKYKKSKVAKFAVPTFVLGDDINPEQSKELDKLDVQLKEYMTYYFSVPTETTENEPVTADSSESDPMED